MYTTDILIVDPSLMVAEGIGKVLGETSSMKIVGYTDNVDNALEMLKEHQPDILLVNPALKGMHGLGLSRYVKEGFPETHIIFLVDSYDMDFILEAFKSGARGCLEKDISKGELVKQIERVRSGGLALMSSKMQQVVIEAMADGGKFSIVREEDDLTDREQQVVALVAEGATNREIAGRIFISENTARAHIRTIMQKLHLDNRTKIAT